MMRGGQLATDSQTHLGMRKSPARIVEEAFAAERVWRATNGRI